MYAYQTPGLYFEWLDHKPPAITPHRTDIAGFVGIAERGPLHQPIKVESWIQFISTFGSHTPQGYLAYAVEGFFANGGQTCWVVRIADPDIAHTAYADISDIFGSQVLQLQAISPGVWGNDLRVQIILGDNGLFSLQVRSSDGFLEMWRNLTLQKLQPGNSPRPHPRFIETVLNNSNTGSRFINAQARISEVLDPTEPITLDIDPNLVQLEGGSDGLAPMVDLVNHRNEPVLRLTVRGSLSVGQTVSGSVESVGEQFRLVLSDGRDSSQLLSMNPIAQNYVEAVVNDDQTGSRVILVQDLTRSTDKSDSQRCPPRSQPFQLAGGLSLAHFNQTGPTPDKNWGLATLEMVDEVSIVAVPDIMHKPPLEPRQRAEPICCGILEEAVSIMRTAPPQPLTFPPRFDDDDVLIEQLQAGIIQHCEKLKDRFAVLDLRLNDVQSQTPLAAVANWRNNYDSKYAALYYPWVGVPDPLALEGLLRTMPPSGHVAGLYARVDSERGVHKPPANETLEGVKNVSARANDRLHGDLNDENVNVIRVYDARGIRVAGARTLSRDPEWRYINIRRLLIMIGEAIDENTQWTVFEPNNPTLWADIQRVVRSFLRGLWEHGMLDGGTQAEAFSVRCDISTNPPEETDRGRIICEIVLNPPWPAEFVVVRIGKTEGGLEILDEARA